MNESELIQGCIKGDSKSERMLYEQYAPKMYAVCLRYARTKAEAQDYLQEGFIKVFETLKGFRNEGSLEGWIRRIIVNVILKSFRKMAYKMEVKDDYAEPFNSYDETLDRINEKELIAMIAGLPTGYRMVFNLSVLDGFSHKEISLQLNITESTSRSQLVKARNMLQQKIKQTEINISHHE